MNRAPNPPEGRSGGVAEGSDSAAMLRALVVSFALAALSLAGSPTAAQIEALDLERMTAVADGCILGEIVGREVFRVDHPVDGPGLYFTTLRIRGKLLGSGAPRTVEVTFWGGFVDEENGVYNSEAPSLGDTRLGRQVVAFYKWSDDMGGGVAANVLLAAHGGLYTVFGADPTRIVQGRGHGYAVRDNMKVDDLRARIRAIRSARQAR